MNAVVYARYSTDNQNPDTIEVQVERCGRYASEHGITVTDIYADEAVSGMKSHRPEFDRLLTFVRSGQCEAILIYDQSRMFRDMIEWFLFHRETDRNHVRLISVTQPLVGGDLNDPTVFASEGITALVNQIHVLQTRQKVVEKMNFMAHQAIPCGGFPPLGYSIQNNHYVINETEAGSVRLIFSMYADGKSYNEIVHSLNGSGARTRSGKLFGKNSLHDILCNERYIGVYTYNKSPARVSGHRNYHAKPDPDRLIRVEDAIPAIIDRPVWDRAQRRRLGQLKPRAANKAQVVYYLSGKVVCGSCGSSMSGMKSNRKYHYYSCTRKSRVLDCRQKDIQKDLLESLCARAVLAVFTAPRIQKAADRVMQEISRLHANIPPDQRRLFDQLKKKDAELLAINEAIAQGVYSASTKSLLDQKEKEKQLLLLQISEIKQKENFSEISRDEVVSVLTRISKLDPSTDSGLSDICGFVSRVIVYEDHIVVYTTIDDAPIPHEMPVDQQKPIFSVLCSHSLCTFIHGAADRV